MPLARLLAAALIVSPAAAQTVARPKAAEAVAAAAIPASASISAPASHSTASSPISPVAVFVPGSTSPASGASPVVPAKTEERVLLDKLSAENQLVREEVSKRLRDLVVEKEELRIKSDVQAERQKAELSKVEAEFQRLSLENRLNEERNKKSLEDIGIAQRRLAAENQLDEEKHKRELGDLRQAREKLQQDNDILREKLRAEEMKFNSEKLALDLEGQRMASEGARMRLEREKLEDKVNRLKIDLDERAKKEDWKSQANRDPQTPAAPFKDGVLTVSDRRIVIDGPVITGVGQSIVEKIEYFNNVSTSPIFIVIENCNGGSVMEGQRMIEAIQASKAPVHVVLKGYAFSLAATILAIAPHSYAYRNSVILHHQPLNFNFGNPVQQKESLEKLKEWYQRLDAPIAKKMGITLEQFTEMMYKNNSDGDWQEFGDKAVKLKWVDHVVEEIRETGVTRKPPEGKNHLERLLLLGLKEEVDERGERFVRLPRLERHDAYWIHNPDRYFR